MVESGGNSRSIDWRLGSALEVCHEFRGTPCSPSQPPARCHRVPRRFPVTGLSVYLFSVQTTIRPVALRTSRPLTSTVAVLAARRHAGHRDEEDVLAVLGLCDLNGPASPTSECRLGESFCSSACRRTRVVWSLPIWARAEARNMWIVNLVREVIGPGAFATLVRILSGPCRLGTRSA